ncbi:MAG: hypothetical protein WBX25_20120 [Rhodomicrobium sp.]
MVSIKTKRPIQIRNRSQLIGFGHLVPLIWDIVKHIVWGIVKQTHLANQRNHVLQHRIELELSGVRYMAVIGVRRAKAALSSGCKSHPAHRSSRKQPEQILWGWIAARSLAE